MLCFTYCCCETNFFRCAQIGETMPRIKLCGAICTIENGPLTIKICVNTWGKSNGEDCIGQEQNCDSFQVCSVETIVISFFSNTHTQTWNNRNTCVNFTLSRTIPKFWSASWTRWNKNSLSGSQPKSKTTTTTHRRPMGYHPSPALTRLLWIT